MSALAQLHELRVRLAAKEATTESLALAAGAIAFLIAALLAWPVLGLQPVDIAGPGSLGEYVAIASAAVALAAFVGGRVLSAHHHDGAGPAVITGVDGPLVGFTTHRAPRFLDVAALALAHGVIFLLMWTGIADLLEKSFQGAEVFTIPALILSGAAAAVSAYFSYLSAAGMNAMRLSGVLLVFLVVGSLTAMLTSNDPDWWRMNLSALGITDDVSAMAFNLTLIVAGVILTTIARYATAGLIREGEAIPRGVRFVRWGLVVMGIALACVGIFHVDDFFLIHNTVATGMVVAFAVLVAGLPRFLPQLPKTFMSLGYLFLAVIVFTAVLFATGYYNLTAVELVAAVLIFSWIIVFLRTVSATSSDERRTDAAEHRARAEAAVAESAAEAAAAARAAPDGLPAA
ncbi:DUF998 domain-containing protein [Microterricola viridarii]|uniref:DUF998 domain-containing protein n=1 Tax=Microterricola viridarii TaxID=412690 RepID=A0A1H1LCF9_9MICO|nr:DUF998 domain-containing protein [Microterricola viridarii]SDR72244.1 Protein of unknown function [Microterricola viridarii]